MKKLIALIIVSISLTGCAGLEFLASDIDGWNFSACVDGFSVCQEFFEDNQDKFLGQ